MIVRIVKSDGGVEEYLHTKVLLCISNALCAAHEWDVGLAEELAGAVTAFVYGMGKEEVISGDILGMIRIVLTETGYGDAAAILGEYHSRRGLARRRTEMIDSEMHELCDAETVRAGGVAVRQWSKNHIVEEIVRTYGLERHAARAAAGRVEEKVLAMGMPRVWSGLVKQIMMAETAVMLRAQEHLGQA
jgi:hypothetical protein